MTSLMHLPLTFAGVVCILSLQGPQEQCPFTTRLRVLKLTKIKSCSVLLKERHHSNKLHTYPFRKGVRTILAWAPGRGQAIAPTMLRADRHIVHSRGDGLSSPIRTNLSKDEAKSSSIC